MADTSTTSSSSRLEWLSAIGRIVLLALLAGHLLFRREFAHRNFGEALSALGVSAPAFLNQAYITETLLVFLLVPAALLIAWKRKGDPIPARPGEFVLAHGLGPAFYVALAFVAWGAAHAAYAFVAGGRDNYLIVRQSALAAYAMLFACAYIFCGDRTRHVREAVFVAIGISILCAIADAAGLLVPRQLNPLYPAENLFGQQTLPLGILALGLLFIYADGSWLWRGAALAGLAFLGWRQSLRIPQSAVVIGFAGALLAYLVLGACVAFRGQVNTMKRAVLLAAFFGVLFLVYRGVSKADGQQTKEVHAWSPATYQRLFHIYENTGIPEKLNESTRKAGEIVKDPEVYKLNAVYHAAGSVSVINNMWRLLVWRRMFSDFRSGAPFVGAGPGKAWFYPALYHSYFHYGDDREGLDPHNSFLNVLYRYGAIGFSLLALTIVIVLWTIWKALSRHPAGDALLEGLLIFFCYSATFAFFTVSLEGPSYSLPFWVSLGCAYAYARQILRAREESLLG
ncbi:MAG TPA: hypothetical protein VEK08_15145 [Planctomycetota bacterium]|nr:hypothetical protein [Planctomycetota bacterium]